MMVMGASMEPALHPGQLALLQRNYYRTHALERDDVVVFRWKGCVYVKRVYALAGETVRLACVDGHSWPISKTEARRYGPALVRRNLVRLRTVLVPAGRFFSLGDNTNASVDSRELGPIPVAAILGRVAF